MISFDDTEIAFAGKSDKDLQWSYRLFKMIGKPTLVKFGKVFTNMALKLRFPFVKGMIKATIYKHFCGGETIQDCDDKITDLGRFGIGTILDYSVEGKDGDEDLDHTRDEIIQTIQRSKSDEKIPFCVFKPTGIARTDLLEKVNVDGATLTEEEEKDHQAALARFDSICKAAYELDVPVFVDAEDSWFQDWIDRTTNEMMARYNTEKAIVYNTVQMYRHDRLEFLKKTAEQARSGGYKVGIKLVRGAYMEKEHARAAERAYPTPIQPSKEATDRDYNAGLELMVDQLDHFSICAGTHNEKSSQYLVELLEKKGIDRADKRVYFAQLLGMSDHISFNLAHAGYNVAKYVPYGPVKEVMPYLIRRAQENTSVAGQMGRELGLIVAEKKRRKSLKK